MTTSAAEDQPITNKKSLIALLPFAVFLGIFLGTGIILTLQGVEFAFYQLPASIAIIPAIFVAIYLGKVLSKEPIDKQIGQFISGAGHANIMTMCIIYLLAGAFATVAKATGSVDASVQLGLAFFPTYLLLPGLFLVAAFLSTAMGTSMGTIAAIAPIALGFIESAGIDSALVAGCLISGAIFGDNLSIISDTTIASTRSQGAHMKDKFKVNFKFAVPAAIICLIIFSVSGQNIDYQLASDPAVLGLIPYIVILILALSGVNVFVVLSLGIVLAAAIGMLTSDYQLSALITDINAGFSSMQDIFILSLFIGGLSELIRHQGGLSALTKTIESFARKLSPHNKKRAAGLGIAGLTFGCNFFTANNTVSIIITGETAKDLATDGELTPAQSASLLDVFACINQGLLPYGAQALLLGSTLSISPLAVISHAFYPMILFFTAGIAFWRMTKN
ncbi:Na+/H+ antiporter NhaC family protein [Colwellia sp. 4_MG-2023]|jgi:Na+/H+ antiporter NhaC|uniref:Na+/H+ antiporter NhaC family protein n=1 Tax=unclassified Colwellia TaxID=196834 RepID=UPI001C08EB14|nr:MULTISPECIES: Na+/H+ antiporter NhaC family protein [unclassified Colwellia]MBU2924562.1 Na+/H+ antiporter NhaC family protein [Colwellia sp. C2M11]MDO6489039.1 Na+/H+ antiporter NhaC family protein [Colwellia sp. 6_MG-2023]MDO6508366.1 Na+/H+ antiporter NhaC family protein [Colwellia sp. 5_MG-2023]MDO6556988.1 Na+/H+ antiporter NhaC family protein [Colwellia sp. 4_MG-2023]MDO6653963.1 Na+/H+ antiporter NhaC family protein [Colwellia sp. 3_MG-2023]